MHGHKAVNSHPPLLLMVGRCVRRPDIRIGDQDGSQATGFPHLAYETKISAKIGNFREVLVHKPSDTWPQGGELALAFVAYGRKMCLPT